MFDKSDGIGDACVGVEGGDGDRLDSGIDGSAAGLDRSPLSMFIRGRNIRDGN